MDGGRDDSEGNARMSPGLLTEARGYFSPRSVRWSSWMLYAALGSIMCARAGAAPDLHAAAHDANLQRGAPLGEATLLKGSAKRQPFIAGQGDRPIHAER